MVSARRRSAAWVFGRRRSRSARKVETRQKNMPAFHRYRLEATYLRARASGGFSVKRRTAKTGSPETRSRSRGRFDVAESGVGPRGRDAQADQRTGARGDVERGANDLAIARRLRDHMIGGENGHQRVGRRGMQKMNGGQADRGRGVAPDGFGEDVPGGDLWQLAPDLGGLFAVGHDPNV